MGIILVEGIQIYAYHGCLPEEAKTGRQYIVDVEIETDFSEAAVTDDITKTVNYSDVYAVVKREMAIRSRLIEHVAKRIHDTMLKELSRIQKVKVKVTKLHPPIEGVVERACVVYTL